MKVDMVSSNRQGDRRRLRMVRIALAVCFFVNGMLSATLSTRLPAVQTRLALLPGQLGLALLGCTIGGLVAMNIAGRIARRSGRNVLTIASSLCSCSALPLIAFAPTLPLLLLALVYFGVGNGAMDIMLSIQGADVEREYGRPVFNSFHACFSVGGLAGAFLGDLLAALNVSPELHFLAIAVLTCAGIVWSSRFLLSVVPLPAVSGEHRQKALARYFSLPLVLLGLIAFCALLSVGAMFDWSAVYLSGTLHTGAGLAAAAFATFLLCMALGRGAGDYLTVRIGAVGLVRLASMLAAIGLALALLFAWLPAVFFGFCLVGFGLSVPFPLVLSAVGRIFKRDASSALATVTTLGYFGLLAGPAVIGFVADRVGLRLALVLVVCLCVIAALCAPVVGAAGEREVSLEEEDN